MTTSVPAQPLPAPAYRPPRPPLDARSRAGARLAGMVGFGLLSLGYALVALVITALALGAVIVTFLSVFTDEDITTQDSIQRTLTAFDAPAFIVAFVVVAVFGVLLWVAGLLLSNGILKAHGVAKHWGVTWSAFGIAIVVSWVVDGTIFGVMAVIASVVGTTPDGGLDTAYWVTWSVSGLLNLVASVFIGWLCWLWMTIALRPSA